MKSIFEYLINKTTKEQNKETYYLCISNISDGYDYNIDLCKKIEEKENGHIKVTFKDIETYTEQNCELLETYEWYSLVPSTYPSFALGRMEIQPRNSIKAYAMPIKAYNINFKSYLFDKETSIKILEYIINNTSNRTKVIILMGNKRVTINKDQKERFGCLNYTAKKMLNVIQ